MDTTKGTPPADRRPGGILRNKGILYLLAAVLTASLLVWIPIIGRFSLDDPQPIQVHPSSINQDPKPFLGRKVQVEGEVERIYGPRAFALLRPAGEPGAAAPAPGSPARARAGEGSGILIVGQKPWTLLQRNPQTSELVRNDHVQVMGRVRRFSLRDFQEESGGHPSDSLLARFEGKPVLMALDIELTPGVPDLFPGTGGPGQRGVGGGDAPGAARRGGRTDTSTLLSTDSAMGTPR